MKQCKIRTARELKCLFVVFSLVWPAFLQAQNIPSLDFNHARKYWEANNDTTYVVNFWATWCGPCVKELPLFDALADKYRNKPVKVLLVSLDMKSQVPDKLSAFLEKKKIRSEVIHLDDRDANRWIPMVDETWTGAIPATLILQNKRGKKYFVESEIDEKKLQDALNQIYDE